MKKTGFGLLETSLILMIVAFMTISALSLYNLSERNISKKASKLKENNYLHNIERLSTRSRLNKIYEEIKYFVLLHHRLPCPANNNSGNEDDNPGSCDNSSTFLTNNNIVYGTLPYNSLNLTNEIVKDKFNNDFTYYVDKRFTAKTHNPNGTNGFAATKTMYDINNDPDPSGRVNDTSFEIINVSEGSNKIEPKDGLNSDIRPNSSYLFVIVSPGDDNNLNAENSDNNNIFKTIDENDNKNKDILLFKNKQEILKNAKVSTFFCAKNDSKIIFNDHTQDNDGNLGSCASGASVIFENIIYIEDNYAKINCPSGCSGASLVRKCGEYGIWQDITSMIPDQCM